MDDFNARAALLTHHIAASLPENRRSTLTFLAGHSKNLTVSALLALQEVAAQENERLRNDLALAQSRVPVKEEFIAAFATWLQAKDADGHTHLEKLYSTRDRKGPAEQAAAIAELVFPFYAQPPVP